MLGIRLKGSVFASSLWALSIWSGIVLADAIPSASPAAYIDWPSVLDPSGDSPIVFGAAIEGPEPFLKNSDHLFAPASVTKVLMTATSIEELSPLFHFETKLDWDQSGNTAKNLVVTGDGDPSWGMRAVDDAYDSQIMRWVKVLRDKGVEAIEGKIEFKLSDARLAKREIPTSWEDEDLNYCYGAVVEGFNLNENCGSFELSSASSGKWLEDQIGIPVSVRLTRSSVTDIVVRRNFNFETRKFSFSLTGKWDGSTYVQRLPIPDPGRWIHDLLVQRLRLAGVEFLEEREGGGYEHHSELLAGAPLYKMIKGINKPSINMGADGLLRALGRIKGNSDLSSLWQAGLEVLRRHREVIAERNHASGGGWVRDEIMLEDGSGLSREGRVSPRAMMVFLKDMMSQSYFSWMWESLPIAGVDGTLEKRMKDSPAQGKLRAKTGTLSGFYQLAGYVPYRDTLIPFVVFTETTSTYRVKARAAQDRVGIVLAQFI